MSSKNELREYAADLFKAFGGQDAILVIPRPYLTLCDNDHRAALLLSQCVYWSDRTRDPEGWFAKSYVEWANELGLSEYEVRRAAKALVGVGLETKLKKFNGAPVVHYRIDRDKFSESILKKLQNPSSTTSRIDSVESQGSLTESTTESTTDTKDIAPVGAPTPQLPSEELPAPTPPPPSQETSASAETLDSDTDPGAALYPCTPADVNALIAAWYDWVPTKPTSRGKVTPSKNQFANKTNREFAENLVKRGVLPADMIRFLADIRYNDESRWAHLKDREMTFSYAAEIVQEWTQADREENWYTPDAPRITARKPGVKIDLGEISDGDNLLQRFKDHPDLIVDVPPPYITAQAAAGESVEPSESSADDATLLDELEKMGVPL